MGRGSADMTTARGILGMLATGFIALSQMSCNTSDCDSLSPHSTVSVYNAGERMWVGATHRLSATGYGIDCEHYVVSDQQPDSFKFVSDNSAVASITDKGILTALTPGKVTITVSYDGHTQTIPITVHQPVATVAATFTPGAPKVGNLVTVTFEARTADGQAIKEAKLTNSILFFPAGKTTSEYATFLPDTSQTVRAFNATAAGTYQTYSSVDRLGGPQTTFTSKVVITP
jgi:hypothetical protein